MKDTARILITTKCNYSCEYCCNNQYQFNKKFFQCSLNEVGFSKYENICITGGELLLDMSLIRNLYPYIKDKTNILYSNGVLLTKEKAIEILNTKENKIC